MEDEGNNSGGSGGTRRFGEVQPSVHRQFIDPDDLGQALAKVRDYDVWWAVKCCLIFMAFTCVRSNQARGATWDEVDLNNMTWTIPAIRMKNNVLHRVALSTEAVEVLAYAREQGGDQGLIFPSQRGGKVIHSGALSRLFLELQIPGVPHGLRASFMNWAVGRIHIPRPVAEMVLGHQSSNAVVRSFLRSELYERCVPVMQEWADFIAETMGPVVPADAESR